MIDDKFVKFLQKKLENSLKEELEKIKDLKLLVNKLFHPDDYMIVLCVRPKCIDHMTFNLLFVINLN